MKFIHLLPLSLALALFSCKSKEADAADGTAGSAVEAGSHVLATSEASPRAGLVLMVREEMRMPDGAFGIEAPQGQMEGTAKMVKIKETRVENRSADEVRVEVIEAEESQTMTMNGQELPGQAKDQPLLGKPVIVTRVDGEWTAAKEDGSEATEAEATELEAILKNVREDSSRMIYGTEARKPGDSWTVDAKDAPWMGEAVDAEGELAMTFDKVGTHQGMECAFLSGTFDISGKPPEMQDGMEGTMTMKGTVSIIRSLQHLQDLVADMTGEMNMEMTLPVGKMTLKGPMTMKMGTTISE